MPNAAQAVLWILASFCVAAFCATSYWVSAVIAGQPYRRRSMVIHSLLLLAQSILPKVSGMNSGSAILAMLLCSLLSARLAFGQRKVTLLVLSLKLIASWVVLEFLCACLMMPLVYLGLPAKRLAILKMEEFLDPGKVVLMYGYAALAQSLLAGMLMSIRRASAREKKASRRRLYFKVSMRLLALVLLGGGALYFSASYYIPLARDERFLEQNAVYTVQIIISAGLLMVAVSYLAQDIRYIDQLRRNETLDRQRAVSQSMLKNLRFFRHNMINLLYGLEGVILNGSTEDIRAYYNEMEKRCALVNNENIIMLERLNQPAFSSVLLHATDAAAKRELPFSLYVQEGLKPAHGLNDAEICQVLGVLVDNALEAAAEAQDPFVLIEMRNVDGMLEVLVKNTFLGPVDEIQFRSGSSSKPGHAGVGLASCYDLLEHRRGALLNVDVGGQYVRAQLLIKM